MIPTFFNGIMTVLLANWALNEMPHAAGILEAERNYGKRLGAGNPATRRVERTTVDKVIDDLERTLYRIAPDMSIRMQSALSILKNIMGFYYEELAVVAWDDTNLVGIAVYKTAYDVDLQTQETHIAELASFAYEPGVGRLLVEEVIRIAREKGSSAVTVWHGPGVRSFYEGLGFVTDVRHPEIPTSMMYKLTNGNLNTAVGTCYEDAWRFLGKQGEGTLVHGSIQLSAEGPRVNHAWVELATGWVWEPQTNSFFTIEDFKMFSPIEDHRYTIKQAFIITARTGNMGPWTDEEREQWLK